MNWKKLWPWAKRAVTVKVSVNENIIEAIEALQQHRISDALDAIAAFVREDREKYLAQAEQPHAGVLALLDRVESTLQTAANEYEMSFK